jgi:hypothetical protein
MGKRETNGIELPRSLFFTFENAILIIKQMQAVIMHGRNPDRLE